MRMRRASRNKSKEMNDMERTITADHPRATKKGEEHRVKDNTNMKRKHLKHWATPMLYLLSYWVFSLSAPPILTTSIEIGKYFDESAFFKDAE